MCRALRCGLPGEWLTPLFYSRQKLERKLLRIFTKSGDRMDSKEKIMKPCRDVTLEHRVGFVLGALFLTLCLVGLPGKSFAETISLTPEGSLTIIESTAPLAAPLAYVSGGTGLTGYANCWPTSLTCFGSAVSPAAAASAADHLWLQFDPAIIWSSSTPLSQVFAVPGLDHLDLAAGEDRK